MAPLNETAFKLAGFCFWEMQKKNDFLNGTTSVKLSQKKALKNIFIEMHIFLQHQSSSQKAILKKGTGKHSYK